MEARIDLFTNVRKRKYLLANSIVYAATIVKIRIV